jgi:hypothetical protein
MATPLKKCGRCSVLVELSELRSHRCKLDDLDESDLEEGIEASSHRSTASACSSTSVAATLPASGPSLVSELIAAGRIRPVKGASVTKLDAEMFISLAECTEKWSEHHGKKTVTFRRGVINVCRRDAEHNSKFDNYIDNGPVALSFYALLQCLLGHAGVAKETGNADVFAVLAHLYRSLVSMRDDACNQECVLLL